MFKFAVVLCALVVCISCRYVEEKASDEASVEKSMRAEEVEEQDAPLIEYDEINRTKRNTADSTSSESSESCEDDTDSFEVGLTVGGEGSGNIEFDGLLKNLLGFPVRVQGEGKGHGGGYIKFSPVV